MSKKKSKAIVKSVTGVSNFKTGYKDIAEMKFDGATIDVKRRDAEWIEEYKKLLEIKDEESRETACTLHYASLIQGWGEFVYKGLEVPFNHDNVKVLINTVRFKNAFITFTDNNENWATEEELDFNFDLSN